MATKRKKLLWAVRLKLRTTSVREWRGRDFSTCLNLSMKFPDEIFRSALIRRKGIEVLAKEYEAKHGLYLGEYMNDRKINVLRRWLTGALVEIRVRKYAESSELKLDFVRLIEANELPVQESVVKKRDPLELLKSRTSITSVQRTIRVTESSRRRIK